MSITNLKNKEPLCLPRDLSFFSTSLYLDDLILKTETQSFISELFLRISGFWYKH